MVRRQRKIPTAPHHLLRDPSSPELAGPAADIRNPIIGADLRLSDIRLGGRNLFFHQGVNGPLLIQATATAAFHENIAHPHCLIVEDEPWIAMDLEMIIIKIVTATVVIEGSVATTKEALHEALDFAFLDVDVTNGKTFEIAHILERKRVSFVFVSGSPQDCGRIKPIFALPQRQALRPLLPEQETAQAHLRKKNLPREGRAS